MRLRESCPVCDGDGYLPEFDDDEDVDVASAIVCEECGGDGFLDDGIKAADDAEGNSDGK